MSRWKKAMKRGTCNAKSSSFLIGIYKFAITEDMGETLVGYATKCNKFDAWQRIVNNKLGSSSAVALTTLISWKCLIDAHSKDKNRQEIREHCIVKTRFNNKNVALRKK